MCACAQAVRGDFDALLRKRVDNPGLPPKPVPLKGLDLKRMSSADVSQSFSSTAGKAAPFPHVYIRGTPKPLCHPGSVTPVVLPRNVTPECYTGSVSPVVLHR